MNSHGRGLEAKRQISRGNDIGERSAGEEWPGLSEWYSQAARTICRERYQWIRETDVPNGYIYSCRR